MHNAKQLTGLNNNTFFPLGSHDSMIEDPYGTTCGAATQMYASKYGTNYIQPSNSVYGNRSTEPIYGSSDAYNTRQTHQVLTQSRD